MNKSSAHLLVVDDDPVTVDLLKEVLTKEGYEVATALSGEEAIARGWKILSTLSSQICAWGSGWDGGPSFL